MTKQKKLRHAEYYDMQEVLDKLYVDSKDNKTLQILWKSSQMKTT